MRSLMPERSWMLGTRQKLKDAAQVRVQVAEEELKEDDFQVPLVLPNLGRLTKFLLSADRKVRLKGLQLFHTRHWHASVKDMQKFLDRAGVDIAEAELKLVVALCKACRMWQLPRQTPKDRRGGPERFCEQVEFDYLIYKNHPISVTRVLQ